MNVKEFSKNLDMSSNTYIHHLSSIFTSQCLRVSDVKHNKHLDKDAQHRHAIPNNVICGM